LAIAAAKTLVAEQDIQIREKEIRLGLQKVKFPGRFEIVQQKPIVVLDGAHNPSKAQALKKTFQEIYPNHRLILVIGVLKDHNVYQILNKLFPLVRKAVVTMREVPGREVFDPKQIVLRLKQKKIQAKVKLDPQDAFDWALNQAGPKDIICVTGSLFLVGEIRKRWFSVEDILKRRNNL